MMNWRTVKKINIWKWVIVWQKRDKLSSRNMMEQKTNLRTKKLFQRASPMKLMKLYSKLTEDQRILIRRAKYRGLLDIKCLMMYPEFCQYLMDSFDPSTCSMVFPGRGSIPLTEGSVHEVLEVPNGHLEVVFKHDKNASAFMRDQYGTASRAQPTMTALAGKIAVMRPTNSKFLRFYIIYAMCLVLAPTTGVHVSPRVYPSLINIKEAKHLNICRFVITIIRKSLNSDGDNEQVMPCMLYLMVKYVDFLQLQDMEVTDEGTRVAVWTNTMIKEAIKQDTKIDSSFGAASILSKLNLQKKELKG